MGAASLEDSPVLSEDEEIAEEAGAAELDDLTSTELDFSSAELDTVVESEDELSGD